MTHLKIVWHLGKRNIIGVGLCFVLFCSGFAISGETGLFLNLSGLILVFGGTATSILLAYPAERLVFLYKVLVSSYTRPVIEAETLIRILVDLSIKRKVKGILALQKDEEETTIIFLRRAIGLLVDNHPSDQIMDSLGAEMYFFKQRRYETIRLLQTMADVAPSFGLVGSVVGLIGMLAGIGDSATLIATIPIALTSTLYGIIVANMFCLPFSVNIRERTSRELLLQKIITEGIVAIAAGDHPRNLDRRLKAFLTPSARKEEVISISRIKEILDEKERVSIPETPDV